MGKKVDITGERFGRLLVIEELKERDRHKRVIWKCRCDCGNEVNLSSNPLRMGHTTSCGCYHSEAVSESSKRNKKDLVGKKFGRLTVIKDTGKRRNRRSVVWLCRCDCGKRKEVTARDLKIMNTTSCGCLFQEFIVKKNIEFGKVNRGPNHPNWNVNLTEKDRARNRSRLQDKPAIEWRKRVFKRDKHTCVVCGYKGNEINAHHLDGWNWCEERRFDITNGVTLCKACHIKFHKNFGYGYNTEIQFNEFVQATPSRTTRNRDRVVYE